jgi:hypothetical protein
MADFVALAPGVLVSGDTVLAVINELGEQKPRALEILAEHKIAPPQAGKWYPQQNWLNGLRRITAGMEASSLIALGRKIQEAAAWPPEIDSLQAALASIDATYHQNHRNGEVGQYLYEKTSLRSGKMVCSTPYPCDFDRGILSGVSRKFKPADVLNVRIVHDDTKPCRKKGAASCTLLINW